ncbi:unnamed protein product [Linum trigynum]|uniref:Uncharacterized protein n=1 Tax=Linum trigynum TaxID=586398 RepID=A0AAV2FWA6_9ROSI
MQVFYIEDLRNGGSWRIVHRVSPRHVYDVPEMDDVEYQDLVYDSEPFQQDESINLNTIVSDPDEIQLLSRTDVAPIILNEQEVSVMEHLLASAEVLSEFEEEADMANEESEEEEEDMVDDLICPSRENGGTD